MLFFWCCWIKHPVLNIFFPRASRDEERFGVFRENFIQPVVLHVPLREFPFLYEGSEAKQPRGEVQGATHLLYKHGKHRHGGAEGCLQD